MLQEFDVNLDLTEIFSLKKISAYSSDLSLIEYIREYKYITEVLNHFQYGDFKTRLKFIK